MQLLPKRMHRALALAATLAMGGSLAVAATSPAANADVGTATHAATAASVALPAGDSPGFWYGTDSLPITITGTPYQEPRIGGRYGGYIGMTGSWSHWLGCKGGFLAWSSANAAEANANYTKYGVGVGLGVYWFMGGPGVDPHYNGSTTEAYAWGQR